MVAKQCDDYQAMAGSFNYRLLILAWGCELNAYSEVLVS